MTKHYIGATKKNRTTNSKKPMPKLPNFGTLAIGSLIGVLLTTAVFYMFSTSDITLKIPTAEKIAVDKKPVVAELDTKKDAQAPEPRFDFYTELTKGSHESSTETVQTALKPVVPTAPSTAVSSPVTTHNSRLDLKYKPKAINAYLIQAGSFKNRAEADSLRATLTLNGQDTKIETAKLPNGETWHRVMLGPFTTEKSARSLQQLLKSYDINGILVVKYSDR